jgi:hypothetical protein
MATGDAGGNLIKDDDIEADLTCWVVTHDSGLGQGGTIDMYMPF